MFSFCDLCDLCQLCDTQEGVSRTLAGGVTGAGMTSVAGGRCCPLRVWRPQFLGWFLQMLTQTSWRKN